MTKYQSAYTGVPMLDGIEKLITYSHLFSREIRLSGGSKRSTCRSMVMKSDPRPYILNE
jgi:hypothetical protein